MKLQFWLTAAVLTVVASSCIKDEPLNAECDIVSATIPGNVLTRAPQISNDRVVFVVKGGTDVTVLAPEFTITPGAAIEPPSGTVRDFTEPQEYTVTSEDGEWHKTYTVEVQMNNIINLEYNFEHVRVYDGKFTRPYSYDIFYEEDAAGNQTLTWASGNPGFALTGTGSTPESFPTFQAEDGLEGKCLELVTRSTGFFGTQVGMPLAAGSLFIGTFDTTNAVARPLEATRFGTPFYNIPRSLTGFFKFAPGEQYCELVDGKLRPVEGRTDVFNIYSVLFEVTADMQMLDGSNALSEDNPNIIAVAEIPMEERIATDEWREFTIPYVYRPGKKLDIQKLLDGSYSITIVCTSSADGGKFSGAVGSTLKVDNLRITCVGVEE